MDMKTLQTREGHAATHDLCGMFTGMNLEDVCLFFHDSEDCPGIVLSDSSGQLNCDECGADLGRIDSVLLSEIIAMLRQVPVPSSQR